MHIDTRQKLALYALKSRYPRRRSAVVARRQHRGDALLDALPYGKASLRRHDANQGQGGRRDSAATVRTALAVASPVKYNGTGGANGGGGGGGGGEGGDGDESEEWDGPYTF